jgi:hypothetical protein
MNNSRIIDKLTTAIVAPAIVIRFFVDFGKCIFLNLKRMSFKRDKQAGNIPT